MSVKKTLSQKEKTALTVGRTVPPRQGPTPQPQSEPAPVPKAATTEAPVEKPKYVKSPSFTPVPHGPAVFKTEAAFTEVLAKTPAGAHLKMYHADEAHDRAYLKSLVASIKVEADHHHVLKTANFEDVKGWEDPTKCWEKVPFNPGDEKTVQLFWGDKPHSTQEDRLYARYEDGTIVPFDGHRIHVGINLKTSNYHKSSELSGDEIRKSCQCVILFNNKPVYGFGGREPEAVLGRTREILTKLFEHPVQLWKGDDFGGLIGRKIWYDRTPAIITAYYPDDGDLVIKAEEGHEFPLPIWAIEDGENDWGDDRKSLKSELFSPHIWWWRKEKVPSDEGVG